MTGHCSSPEPAQAGCWTRLNPPPVRLGYGSARFRYGSQKMPKPSRREVDDEFGAFTHFAGDLHPPTMRFDEGFDQTQSQTEAALGTAFVAAVEAIPDLALFLRGNPHACVAELDR